MKNYRFLLFSLVILSATSYGQAGNVNAIATFSADSLRNKGVDSLGPWKSGGFINLNFSQVSLSNWAPGGEGSFSLASNSNLYANYDKGRTRWDNLLLLSYAIQKTSSESVRKTDDQIDFTTKYGYRFSPASKWYYSLLANFKSQFANGYEYPNDSVVVSHFLAPAFLVGSFGFTYRPTDYFEVFISPVSSRFIIVNDATLAAEGRYGVKDGKRTRKEFGAYLNARFRKEIMTNVTLATRLELFDNYTDEVKSNRTNVDVNWETGILMKVNKLLTASVIFQVVCDDNVLKQTQYRQVIGVGLGYKFTNGK
ncbi:MAG: DUF3078 domain-containing protein [Bacteroidota bacterium]